ncbi:MAG: hypothetical protein IPJ55_18285 [Chloracidobacterium sp.]|nr:hypothetical protein [Chloracidobacterium sp.]
MKSRAYRTFATYLFLFSLLFSATGGVANAQSKPQKPDPNTGGGKKNTRPTPPTEEELKKAEEERKIREEEKTRSLTIRSKRSRPTSLLLTRSSSTKRRVRSSAA